MHEANASRPFWGDSFIIKISLLGKRFVEGHKFKTSVAINFPVPN